MTVVFLFLLLNLSQAELWAVKFSQVDQAQAFAEAHGLVSKGIVLEDIHLFEIGNSKKRDSQSTLKALESLFRTARPEDPLLKTDLNNSQVLWISEQKPLFFEKKADKDEPDYPYTDPLLPEQWHLQNWTDDDHVHINVLPVWEMGITGKGVIMAIIDDGVQVTHPDLARNWYPGPYNWNFNLANADVLPQDTKQDWHGTAVTGLACGAPDGKECGVGVAPDAKFSVIVLLQDSQIQITDAVVAQAVAFQPHHNDIFCISWGPKDDGLRKEAPGYLTQRAMLEAIQKGRGGKGSLYLWAAGNGRANGDNCNYDGYANSRYTSTIGAVSFRGTETPYSEPCCAQIGVLPSGLGNAKSALRTTDLVGVDGKNVLPGSLGNCNSEFAGTSASTPLGAGIAALVLEANPRVSWLDFQYILKLSAFKTDSDHPGWFLNGGGNWVNHEYGFGIIDAHHAVKTAKKMTTNLVETSLHFHQAENKTFAETGGLYLATIPVNLSKTMVIHHVEVILHMKHSFRGHLHISLVSPYGTPSIFAEKHGDSHSDYDDWKFTTLFCWGESAQGNWTLRIEDIDKEFPDKNGCLVDWSLNIFGLENKTEYVDFFKRSSDQEFEWSFPEPAPSNFTQAITQHIDIVKILVMGTVISTIFITVSTIVIQKIKSSGLEMTTTREAAKTLEDWIRSSIRSKELESGSFQFSELKEECEGEGDPGENENDKKEGRGDISDSSSSVSSIEIEMGVGGNLTSDLEDLDEQKF